MPSITGWTRLEPRPRSRDFSHSLEARVADAMWMLTRQWQVGEFQADDAGTAIGARLELAVAPINRYRPGVAGEPQPYDPGDVPLEAVVERESVRDGDDLRYAAEAGLYFLRLLRDRGLETRYRNDYLTQYPLIPPDDVDVESQRFLSVVVGRAPDGVALKRDLRIAMEAVPVSLPPSPSIDTDDEEAVVAAIHEWLDWLDGLYLEPAPGEDAWVANRFEYQFSVSAPADDGEVVLSAREYYAGRLDWYAFDHTADPGLGGRAGPGEPHIVEHVVVPTPVDFDGMPAPRWWEFEDGRVDFGRVDAAPEDLARLLLLEFALVYGNDWLMIPVRLDVGSLCQIRSLVVTDTFGEQIEVPASQQPDDPQAAWGMFYLADEERPLSNRVDPANQYFLLPPVLATSNESSPLEEVALIRDEMANLAWAVERKVQGIAGRPVDRFEEYQARLRQQPVPDKTPVEGAEVAYTLASSIPDHWIPLVPVRTGQDSSSIALQRGAMLTPAPDPVPILPRGRLLTPGRRLIVEDEELPREGAQLKRSYQHTRWINGASLLWVGRQKMAGRGEGSSGLRFDTI